MSRCTSCLLLICLVSTSVGDDVQQDREIRLAQKDYQLELQKLKNKHEAELSEFFERYLEKLASIQETAVKRQQYDRALEIQKEKKRVESNGSLTVKYSPAGNTSLSGKWQEAGYIDFDIIQQGNRFVATSAYQHPTAGEVHVAIQGVIKDGKILMDLRHLKPSNFKHQQRVGTLSGDGDTISGYAIHEGDSNKYWFEWTRK